jgi:hypothetical protein
VGVGDLGALATFYGATNGAQWFQGDFNYDGKVDVGDLGALATNYGTTLGSLAAEPSVMIAAAGSAVVPEPCLAGLLGAGLMMSRRRRS